MREEIELLEDESHLAPHSLEQPRVGPRVRRGSEYAIAHADLSSLERLKAVDAAQESALAAP